jgi:Flp pilus assembly protein TadD
MKPIGRRDPRARRDVVVILLLAATTFAVFGRVAGNGFVNFDDDLYLYENPIVRQGLTAEGFAWAFTTFWTGNWFPLTWLSHMLDCELFGMNAGAHHVVGVLLHALSAALLYLILRGMTGAAGKSAVVAALFALHPLRVESVAWASERKDVLSAFFFLLTIAAYRRWVERPGGARYASVVASLALGLLAKAMLVTVPFVLLLLDYWPLRRMSGANAVPLRRLLREKVPLFALAAASSVVTFVAQRSQGATYLGETLPWGDRVANALVTYAAYLRSLAWPSGLAVFYPYRGDVSPGQWLGALLLLGGLTALAVRASRRERALAVGWFWYLGTLVPVIGLVQVGGQSMADRYTYVPSIGVFLMVAWGLDAIPAASRRRRALLAGLAGAAVLACAVATWRQVGRWRDPATLYGHALRVTRENYLAHNNLGVVLLAQGRVADAVAHHEEAIRIEPRYTAARANLGLALASLGRADEAVAQLREALRLAPGNAAVHANLATALMLRGDHEEAIAHCVEACRIAPGDPRLLNNLAWIRATHPDPRLRDGKGAVELAERACALSGYGDAGCLDTLAAAFAEAGRFPEAVATAKRAISLAEHAGAGALAREARARLARYEVGEPHRDAPGILPPR